MQEIEDRLVHVEMLLTEHERVIEDLNQVIIEQGKTIDRLSAQNQYLLKLIKEDTVKPLSEETPPPHY